VVAQLEMRKELRLVDEEDLCDSLDLNHDAFLYE
jgi:hypothetical protein